MSQAKKRTAKEMITKRCVVEIRECQRPHDGRTREEDLGTGADVLPLAERVRRTANRPGEAAQGTGECPAQAATGRREIG